MKPEKLEANTENYILSDDKIIKGDYYQTSVGVFRCSGHETERELSHFKKVVNYRELNPEGTKLLDSIYK